ncbi:MAG: NrfD/PsrC family molybdoenzyme membrane anchor subunit [Anaerolineae bacterium]
MEAMVWEWPIWVYLWAAGVAGGGYLAAFLVNLFTGRKHKSMLQIATWIGVPLVGIGTILLIVDLGNQLWFWHLLVSFYPLSPMSIGTWLLTLWAICGVGLLVLWLAESEVAGFVALRRLVPLTKILGWINFVLSPLLIAYTGVLLGNTNMPLWTTVLLPTLFVVSAVSTGLAATLLVSALMGKEIPHEFGRAGAILAVLEMLALVGFLVTVPAGILISGSLSVWFWVGVALIGLLVPFGLELWSLRAKARGILVLASTLCVLFGGLVLRAVVVIGGQM